VLPMYPTSKILDGLARLRIRSEYALATLARLAFKEPHCGCLSRQTQACGHWNTSTMRCHTSSAGLRSTRRDPVPLIAFRFTAGRGKERRS
jgi:hypothetical protein